jgi:type II secretory pathway component PulJ
MKHGTTLVEMLVATALSLVLIGAVVQMFGKVAESITDSRSMLESADRIRLAEIRLQLDLQGATATMIPPLDAEKNLGYFEYIEGPIIQATAPSYARNSEVANTPADTTVGDFDDILMFTTHSNGQPFVGKSGANTIQSDVAEVAWFLRGNTLHRRVLLVAPGANLSSVKEAGFHAYHDLSLHATWDAIGAFAGYVPNTLGDLTKRECRYAHKPWKNNQNNWPYDVRGWGQLGLPTIRECSILSAASLPFPGSLPTKATMDFWTNDTTNRFADNYLTNSPSTETRIADDVILTNVIGFDVKAFDTGVMAYVDLGYDPSKATPFCGFGQSLSGLQATSTTARVYDTYSSHYEATGCYASDSRAGCSSDGFDTDGNGIVDDDAEKLTCPPYPIPLRGIQVKIRTFEPDSKQVREVTVVQDFLPQ